MATYLVLIYGVEEAWEAMSDQEKEKHAAGHRNLVAAAGPAVLDTYELESVGLATTLRTDDNGGVVVLDGPAGDGEAVIGGLYVIEAPDYETVTGLAKHLYEAAAGHSAVEIRRVAGAQ